MTTVKRFFATAFTLLFFALPCCAAPAPTDREMAAHMAKLLGGEFSPDDVTVTVKDSHAYAEMKGAVVSGIRIDTMRLEALITGREKPLVDDVDALASLIGYSRGEIILAEKDVNAYFAVNEQSGFSNLAFDFTPKGFRAAGMFSADFIIKLRIRLAAEGVLALKSNGVYLDKVSIFVEKVRQPAALTNRIVARVNPLIEWSSIPFKVEFRKITMDETAASMTGNPRKFEGGSAASWKKPADGASGGKN